MNISDRILSSADSLDSDATRNSLRGYGETAPAPLAIIAFNAMHMCIYSVCTNMCIPICDRHYEHRNIIVYHYHTMHAAG